MTTAAISADAGITEQLAEFVAARPAGGYPPAAAHAGRRTVANAVALAAGAARHQAVTAVAELVSELGGDGSASVLGTDMQLPAQWAALVNGVAVHVEDFDDTHLETVVHPGAPVVPAALALAEHLDATGRELLDAVVLGTEVALRVAMAAGPRHFDRGWHLTGTAGHFGAAAAAARVLGLDRETTGNALGIAGTQAAGLQVALGSMTKALHPGKAAMNGVEAALLAARGFTGPTDVVEARRGFAFVTSPDPHLGPATSELGERWEVERNTFKPYACGIVSHPAIDAALAIRGYVRSPSDVVAISVGVNPIVLDVMGVEDPPDGLQSKFSVYHCVAVGLLDGAAGPAQYSDERATADDTRAVRRLVTVETDDAIARDEAWIRVSLADGTEREHHVEHARGSEARPLTDDELRDKARLVAGPVLGEHAVDALIALALRLEELQHASTLTAAARPHSRKAAK
jgi:2-methylcitrate dehydratase PrpD